MNALQKMLANKQASQLALAAQGAGALPEQVKALVAPLAGSVETGMQSSTGPGADTIVQVAPKPSKELDTEKAASALAVYEDNNFRPLRQIIRGPGGKTKAVNGFFYAVDAEDIRVLDQYVSKGLVSKVDTVKE